MLDLKGNLTYSNSTFMPITKSAKKALRQSSKRRAQNLTKNKAYKTSVKEVKKLALEKRFDDARAKLAQAYQALDKAAKSGSIKKNKASRLKSRLAKKLKVSA